MGLASALVSMGMYDKIKQLISQLAVIKENTTE